MRRQNQYRPKRRNSIHRRKRGQSFIVSAFLALIVIVSALTGQLETLYNQIYEQVTGQNTQQTVSEYTSDVPDGTTLSVTYLDVGQGNCVLVESDQHYMLIDGGDGEHSSFVVSYMQQHGITAFDYVIISHYDSDHLSGVIGVLYQYEVATLLAPDYTADTKIYNSYLTCIDKQNITPVSPARGDTYTLGNATFTVVCPDSYDYDGDNNNSIGIRLTDAYHSFLILGDAEKESENVMISSGMTLKSDVYMVSHHGSNGASTQNFLDVVDPDYAVISVGADNQYGHPNEKVLTRLQNMNINLFRTDLNGTITAYSTPDSIQWQLEKTNE